MFYWYFDGFYYIELLLGYYPLKKHLSYMLVLGQAPSHFSF
jgi:hypothetical protein